MKHSRKLLAVLPTSREERQNMPRLTQKTESPPWGVHPSVCAIRTLCQGLSFYAFFMFTHAVGWVGPAVERFCPVDCARVEACFLSFQEGATLRNENSMSIVRVRGVNRYVLQDVFSSLSLPTHYILVGRLKGSPMNDTAVPRPLAPVPLQRFHEFSRHVRPHFVHLKNWVEASSPPRVCTIQ